LAALTSPWQCGQVSVGWVRTALAGLGLADDQQVTHLILTHAHFDHVGGIDALCLPGTQVITHARFPEELQRQRGSTLPSPRPASARSVQVS
jgi:glyoxylase-like metal-dependent hydrolase (beta-lactamase superfamily II)